MKLFSIGLVWKREISKHRNPIYFYLFCKNWSLSLEKEFSRFLKIFCISFKGQNQPYHQPVLKFPHFFPASLQAKTAGISKQNIFDYSN